jgi:hypothetical protein
VTPTGDTITVQLSDDADGYVLADALRLNVPDPLPLHLDGNEAEAPGAVPVSNKSAQTVLSQAIASWQSTGLTDEQTSRLAEVNVIVAELPETTLGLASRYGTTIWVDTNAAGHGWMYEGQRAMGEGQIVDAPAIDLVTVLAHEVGHILGLADLDPLDHAGHVMASHLPTGTRRLPGTVGGLLLSDDGITGNLGVDPGHAAQGQTLDFNDVWPANESYDFGYPVSSIQHRASGLQTANRLSADDRTTDMLFARLETDAAAPDDDTVDEREDGECDESSDEGDLWSSLYGLDL